MVDFAFTLPELLQFFFLFLTGTRVAPATTVAVWVPPTRRTMMSVVVLVVRQDLMVEQRRTLVEPRPLRCQPVDLLLDPTSRT